MNFDNALPVIGTFTFFMYMYMYTSNQGEKKVHLIRNRSLSCLSDADLKENDKLESTTDQSNNEEKGHQSSIKICTKLSVQSAEEVRFTFFIFVMFINFYFMIHYHSSFFIEIGTT